MTEAPNLPPEMWSALLKIEGTTSATKAMVETLKGDVADIRTEVRKLGDEVMDLRSEMDSLTAERAQQVPEFRRLIGRVDDLETARTELQSSVKTATTIVKFIFGGQLVTMVGAVLMFYNAAVPAIPHGGQDQGPVQHGGKQGGEQRR